MSKRGATSTFRSRLDLPRQDALFLVTDAGKAARINKNSIIPGSLNLDLQIRETVSQALKDSPRSRYEIGAQLSEALGKDTSKAVLDSYSAESKKGHMLPAASVAAFCIVTGSFDILRLICRQAGGAYLPDRETLGLELERIAAEKQDLASREKLVRELLSTLGKEAR